MIGLEQYEDDVNICCRCSCCKFIPMQKIEGYEYSYVCPSITRFGFHSYSGAGKMDIIAAGLRDGFKFNKALLSVIYNCQLCGACGVSCNYAMDMEVQQPLEELRIKAVSEGYTHPRLEKVIKEMRKTGSMVPVKGKRGDWAAGLKIKNAIKEKVDVLYFVGCLTSYDQKMQKLAKATAKILKKGGVNFGIFGNAETCSGGLAYQMGYRKDFLKQAKKNMAQIKKTGIKTVVLSDADDYQAFKVLYDQHGLKGDLEVLHVTEMIARLIKKKKLKLKNKVDLTVTYHDPDRLGRMGEPWIHWKGKKIPGGQHIFKPQKLYRRGTYGVYDPPRDVINAIPGIKFTEMTRIKEYAWSSGSGGGVSVSNPVYTAWTAKERIKEAESTGAKALVTASPSCEKVLSQAVKASGAKLEVYDILELVEQAI